MLLLDEWLGTILCQIVRDDKDSAVDGSVTTRGIITAFICSDRAQAMPGYQLSHQSINDCL
jgi:hypothetical protein